ncbi:MAG: hypothetical protein D6753_09965 [Planctomycetota bacterium]|nr:MAG: hypothetical protein D6753_09965 [Planctomycetota bacterium]
MDIRLDNRPGVAPRFDRFRVSRKPVADLARARSTRCSLVAAAMVGNRPGNVRRVALCSPSTWPPDSCLAPSPACAGERIAIGTTAGEPGCAGRPRFQIGENMNLETNVGITLGALLGASTVDSVLRLVALRKADPEVRAKRLASLRTWWLLAIITGSATALGPLGIAVMMLTATSLGLGELMVLGNATGHKLVTRVGVYAAAGAWFLGLAIARPEAFPGTFLWSILLALTAVHVLAGPVSGFTHRVGVQCWGWLIVSGGLGHAVLLSTLPRESNPVAGPMGWFLFVLILTETNDIAQALIGRRFGAHKKHRLAPVLSPNKTWEGFLGGVFVTLAVAIPLAMLLTPMHTWKFSVDGIAVRIPWLIPACAALLISVVGLVGDLNMSALKRDAGVKDSSQLLPGMGGMLDRIDSLTFTAPAFYHFLSWWMPVGGH